MENDVAEVATQQSIEPTRKDGFFKRLRRRFSSVFRKKNRKKSVICENDGNNIAVNGKTEEPIEEIKNEEPEATEPDEKVNEDQSPLPPAKPPMFSTNFTEELKTKLKKRTRDIDEGEKSPTEAIAQVEIMRNFMQQQSENDVKENGNVVEEKRTFEEKVAMFESQISGGSGSMVNSLSRPDKRLSQTPSGGVEANIVSDKIKEEANDEDPNIIAVTGVQNGNFDDKHNVADDEDVKEAIPDPTQTASVADNVMPEAESDANKNNLSDDKDEQEFKAALEKVAEELCQTIIDECLCICSEDIPDNSLQCTAVSDGEDENNCKGGDSDKLSN